MPASRSFSISKQNECQSKWSSNSTTTCWKWGKKKKKNWHIETIEKTPIIHLVWTYDKAVKSLCLSSGLYLDVNKFYTYMYMESFRYISRMIRLSNFMMAILHVYTSKQAWDERKQLRPATKWIHWSYGLYMRNSQTVTCVDAPFEAERMLLGLVIITMVFEAGSARDDDF